MLRIRTRLFGCFKFFMQKSFYTKPILQNEGIDREKKVVYGGDLAFPVYQQSFGSLLFKRLSDKSRENLVIQVCSKTKSEMTTKTFLHLAVGLAERLSKEGCKKGDMILLMGNNSMYMNVALAGIFFTGAVPVPITYNISEDEFRIFLERIQPKFYGCDSSVLPTLESIIEEDFTKSSKMFIINNDEEIETSVESFEQFILPPKNIDTFKPTEITDSKEELALVMKAGREGTYGLGVGLTHHNLNCVIARNQLDAERLKNSIILLVQKVMWMSGFCSFLMSCCFGSKLVVMKEFVEEEFLQAIEEFKVTHCFLYVSKMWELYKYSPTKNYDLTSCKAIKTLDGMVSPILVDGLKEQINLSIELLYGSSELTGVALESKLSRKEGSVGKLVPQLYGKVVSDQTMKNVGPFEKGHICFKGPTVLKGYINDPKASRRVFDKHGFLQTGMYGYYDDEGYFFIIDLIQSFILYKDHKISPREIEAVIRTIDVVQDVLVAAIPHPTDGYLPIAFVSLKKGEKVSAGDILAYVKNRVEDHKRLRGGVVFISKIPRSRERGLLNRKLFRKVLSKYLLMEEVQAPDTPEKDLKRLEIRRKKTDGKAKEETIKDEKDKKK